MSSEQDQKGQIVPIIGVSGQDAKSRSVTHTMAALRMAGMEPMLLSHDPSPSNLENLSHHLHGIVITGNDYDIDPKRYGGESIPEERIEKNSARVDFEYALVETALEHDIPLLGICGGMQRMNLAAANPDSRGTMTEHVPDAEINQATEDKMATPGYIPIEFLRIDNRSTLLKAIFDRAKHIAVPYHDALPEEVWMENSYHRQAVDKIRKGFKAGAVNTHGYTEAIEPCKDEGPYKEHPFALGVQWHPEFGASHVSAKIFGAFGDAARSYATSRGDQLLMTHDYLPQSNIPSALTDLLVSENPHTQISSIFQPQPLLPAPDHDKSL